MKIYNDSIDISEDGAISFKKPFVQKVQVQAGSFKAHGTDPATLVDYGIGGAYEFLKSKNTCAVLNIAVPTNLCCTENVRLVMAWTGGISTTGNVKWRIKYLWRAMNEDCSTVTPDNTLDVVGTVSATANGTTYSTFTLSPMTTDDKFVIIHIERLSDDIEDTSLNNAYVIGASMEYSCTKLGA